MIDELSRGNKESGFRCSPMGEALVISGWGFWSDELAGQLAAIADDALAVLPPGGALVLDFDGLHPQRPAGEEAIFALLGTAKRRRARVVTFAPNAITRLQVRRVAGGAEVELRVATTLDEALALARAW